MDRIINCRFGLKPHKHATWADAHACQEAWKDTPSRASQNRLLNLGYKLEDIEKMTPTYAQHLYDAHMGLLEQHTRDFGGLPIQADFQFTDETITYWDESEPARGSLLVRVLGFGRRRQQRDKGNA